MLIGAVYAYRQSEVESTKAAQDVERVLKQIRTESLRLSPDDFQIRFMVLTTSAERFQKQPARKPIYISGELGKAWFSFEFVLVGDVHIRAGRGGGGRNGYRYFAQNITFGELDQYPYLDCLNNEVLEFEIPKEVEFVEGNWQYFVDVYIKGRHFKGSVESNMKVRVPISIQ